MNYLAHIYLSGDDESVILGNFIADGVKGKRYLEYPENWQRGILLHRAIDTYTDSHPVVRMSTARLHPHFSHYSGVVVDMFYDHFLARNWVEYHHSELAPFISAFYELLSKHHSDLPDRIQRIMPFMIRDNWLLNYASIEGLDRILGQMNRRTEGRSGMDKAALQLEAHYDLFHEEFKQFFDDLVIFSRQKLDTL